MNSWMNRSAEERALLNPAFCSCLLWQAATGYESSVKVPLSFDVSFLVLPLVLHRGTRESLPNTSRKSLAIWLDENPLSRSQIADNARMLVPFTKEAIMFGGLHGILELKECNVAANGNWKKIIAAHLKESSDEVRICAKRAEFIGGWFSKAGSPSTVMAILGVKP